MLTATLITFGQNVETFERRSMKNKRSIKYAAVGSIAAVALSLAACTPQEGDNGDDGNVTLTWWHNATADPLQGLWEEVAAEFEDANPGVTVEVTGYQNEDLQ